MAKFDDKTGKKFNMLTVKKYLGNSKWLCDCDCGTKDVIASSALLNEIPGRRKKKSCGCLLVKNVPEKEDFFESIDTPEKAYILGLIAADGAVQPELKRIKIDLKDVDEDILIKIQKQIGHTNKLSHYVNKDRTFRDNPKKYDCRISRLVITSEKMVEDVMKLGLVPNKSNTLDVKLNLIPQEFFFDFLRGMFDGDGCLSFSIEKKYADLTLTTSTIMALKLRHILLYKYKLPHNLYPYHRNPENKNNMTIICTNKYSINQILNWMYRGATIYLDRKYKKMLEFKEEYDYPL